MNLNERFVECKVSILQGVGTRPIDPQFMSNRSLQWVPRNSSISTQCYETMLSKRDSKARRGESVDNPKLTAIVAVLFFSIALRLNLSSS